MRRFLFVGLAFLLIFAVAAIFARGSVYIEAASPTSETPEPADASDSGFPLVNQSYLTYNQGTPSDAPILLRQAAFTAYNEDEQQSVWGNVQHRLVEDAEILRLTPNFLVDSESVPELILTESESPTKSDISNSFSFSNLQDLTGVQEYEVPVDQEFSAVVVYDREADSVLAIAQLEPEPVCDEIPKRGALALERPEDAPKTCVAIDDIIELNETGTSPTEVDIEDYRLVVEGMVDNPLNLTFEDLKQYPATSEVVLLICSGFFADNVEWTGVPLSLLFEEAQIDPDYKAIRLESGSDGYWTYLEKDEFKPEDVILAYQVNGEDIPLEHGYPVRVVIKDEYGAKWIKWLKRIEVSEK